MSKTRYLGAGAALALITSAFALPATAQVAVGDERIIVTGSGLTGGVRAPRQGDNDIGVMGLDEYMSRYPTKGEAGFRLIQNENRSACAQSGEWIRRSIGFIERAGVLSAENQIIRNKLVKLGSDINRASWLRRGANVFTTAALCTVSGGWYCGGAVAAGLGNEATGSAYTKQSKLNRRQSLLNSDQSQLQLDMSVMNMEMSIGWAGMINDYCLLQHVDVTIGSSTTSSNYSSAGTSTRVETPRKSW
ncbi:MAG: hypothetical protein V4681_02305 [Patescibacteria group bacterium]